jgi:hypothetical protein
VDGDAVAEVVGRGDLDELLRMVDACVSRRDWEALADLRARCARAYLDTGRQLWPVAAHAAYRLALEAPAPWAASVLVDDGDRFTIGPLPEVAAQTHNWQELAPHIAPGATGVLTAHERVLRGDDLRDIEVSGPPVLELPFRLEPWEPSYALAEYRADTADFPTPPAPALEHVELPAPRAPEPQDDAVRALRDLARAWTRSSNGRADAVQVSGDALGAISALGPSAARVARVDPADAVAWMAWAGASGGAHGRRPGAAAGRFAAWWTAAALAGVLDDWPPPPGHLGREIARLRWYLWDAAEPATGWALHLAVDDPDREIAWALAAVDAD